MELYPLIEEVHESYETLKNEILDLPELITSPPDLVTTSIKRMVRERQTQQAFESLCQSMAHIARSYHGNGTEARSFVAEMDAVALLALYPTMMVFHMPEISLDHHGAELITAELNAYIDRICPLKPSWYQPPGKDPFQPSILFSSASQNCKLGSRIEFCS